jgi:hypothetical protein
MTATDFPDVLGDIVTKVVEPRPPPRPPRPASSP